uniref:Uncharacterized protein n=1 Tax=Ignisphaera aggregans TaxID=334771 RepID=A0A7J2T9I7_9CREN
MKSRRGIAGEINYIAIENEDVCNLEKDFKKMVVRVNIISDAEIANTIKNTIELLKIVKLRLLRTQLKE